MVHHSVKRVADALIRRISRSLPDWKRYTVEQTFPAHAPYQPTLPANLAMLPASAAQRFTEPVYFHAHHIYRLHDVHVTWDGAVFHNFQLFMPSIVYPHFATRFQDTLMLRQWVGEKVEATACVAVCHDQWSVENYYHWLVDTLPKLLLLRQSHPHMVLMLPQPLPPAQLPDYIKQSATVFGFTQFLPLNTRQILRAECVVLPELTALSLKQNPELIGRVQAELVAALGGPAVAATRRVYAARAAQGVRSLTNGVAVEALLCEQGFETVYFEQLTFLEQVRLMRETAVLVGVHGAGMTNILFVPSGTSVIELLNEDYGDLCYFRLASCLGLPYFYVPCQGTAPELANQSDMVVNTALLQHVLAAAFTTRTTKTDASPS